MILNNHIKRYRKMIIAGALILQFVIGATVDTIYVYSESMDTTLANIIVLPEDYPAESKNYPVLYLLHGWSGHFDNWNRKTDLGIYADDYGLIIVCPEGGYAGWYLDSPVRPKSRFKTYIGEEIVQWVDKHYRTVKNKSGRAITGLSMGGHGALYLGMHYPETFGAVGSMSGVLDLAETRFAGEILELIGSGDPLALDRYSVYPNLSFFADSNLFIIIDCGTSDKYIHINRKTHEKLTEMGIPHVYEERPGGHSWEYWTNSLPRHIKFITTKLNW